MTTELDETRLALIALTWLAEPGTWSVYRLVAELGPIEALHRLRTGDVPDAKLRTSVQARMAADDPRRVAEQAAEQTERVGARLVVPSDEEWPAQVRDLERLALTGTRPEGRPGDRPAALLLGTRRFAAARRRWSGRWRSSDPEPPPRTVIHVATEIGFGLADRGWSVVSGGAFGIDAAAHRGALNAAGRTVAVLACGVDRPYPMGNTALFDRIAESGLLISEWLPGAEPIRPRFLTRNRVIAAATTGAALVEAAARSGATQTMRRALALNRPSMIVPGPVTSAMSVGAHELLREHPDARLVTGVPHILEEVGRIGVDLAPLARGPQQPRDLLDDDAGLLLESVPGRGTHSPDTLAARAGLDLRTTLRKLSMLEDLGLLTRRDGGYALAPRSR